MRQIEGNQLPLMINDQMQFEAEKPAHGGLAAFSEALKDTMATDAPIMTDL